MSSSRFLTSYRKRHAFLKAACWTRRLKICFANTELNRIQKRTHSAELCVRFVFLNGGLVSTRQERTLQPRRLGSSPVRGAKPFCGQLTCLPSTGEVAKTAFLTEEFFGFYRKSAVGFLSPSQRLTAADSPLVRWGLFKLPPSDEGGGSAHSAEPEGENPSAQKPVCLLNFLFQCIKLRGRKELSQRYTQSVA